MDCITDVGIQSIVVNTLYYYQPGYHFYTGKILKREKRFFF